MTAISANDSEAPSAPRVVEEFERFAADNDARVRQFLSEIDALDRRTDLTEEQRDRERVTLLRLAKSYYQASRMYWQLAVSERVYEREEAPA